MTASLAAPAGILREVFKGTCTSFPGDADGQEQAVDFGLLSGARPARSAPPLPWAVGVTSFAGAALLLAITALIFSWQSAQTLESLRSATQTTGAAAAELPRLKSGLESLSAEMTRESALRQLALTASETAGETAQAAKAEFSAALDGVKSQQAELNARLEKVETEQTAQASALQSVQLRESLAENAPPAAPPAAAPTPAAPPRTAFHLISIRNGVATVDGPEGLTSVSVGDTLSSLGRVLKIVKHGRSGAVVTEQGRLALSRPTAAKSAPREAP